VCGSVFCVRIASRWRRSPVYVGVYRVVRPVACVCSRAACGRVRAGPVFRALGVSLFGTDSTLSYRKSVMYRCVMVKIEFLSACAVFAHGAAGAGVGPGMWK
jgi:hypothetical protein